jgi:hypothetical protein
VIIIKRDGRIPRGHTYQQLIGRGHTLVYKRGVLNGREVVACVVPKAAEAVAVAKLGGREGFAFYTGDDSDLVASAAPTAAPQTSAADHPVVVMALRNGWAHEDLVGAGQHGRPGPDGGISTRSGLTLSQMALCAPPPSWAEAAATSYPWDLDGWRPPLGFRPGNPPPKATEEKAEVELKGPKVDPEELTDATVTTLDGEPVTPSEDGPQEAEHKLPADPEFPVDEHPAVLAGYPASDLHRALALVVKYTTDEGPPSQSKLNYRLKQADLATAKAEQYAALIA